MISLKYEFGCWSYIVRAERTRSVWVTCRCVLLSYGWNGTGQGYGL